jgi:hypothetical protein
MKILRVELAAIVFFHGGLGRYVDMAGSDFTE